jgi:uncharacterized protein YacL
MLNELLKAALVLVVSFAIRWFLALIGVEIDPELFNTLVAAIVTYLLALLGLEAAKAKAPKYFK